MSFRPVKAKEPLWKDKEKDPDNIWEASRTGDLERVQRILDEKKASVDGLGILSPTISHSLPIFSNKIFKSEFYFVLYYSDEDGRTPLHWASGGGKLNVVEFLLEKGANPNAADESQWTPLLSAASAGHTEVVKLLLLKNADVNAVNDTKRFVNQRDERLV
jgi:ankyrin repeat protein